MRGIKHPRRRMRQAESCLMFIAFFTGILASLGAVSSDPDLVYFFNWAHAEGSQLHLKISLYAGFQVMCTNIETLGNGAKLCAKWDTYDPLGSLCDGSMPPPPSPPPSCVDQPTAGGSPATETMTNGQVVPHCEYYSQCCPGGSGNGPNPMDPQQNVRCGSVEWQTIYCPVTCEAGCGRIHTPVDYHGVMCANMDLSTLNTILWYVGIGFMLIMFLIERCFETTAERRRPKAIADSVLSFLSTGVLVAVLIIYASSCYPGEAFKDIFLSDNSLSQGQIDVIDDIVSPSFGVGFFLACAAAAAMFGAFCFSVVLAYLSVRHGERASDVFV